MVLKKNATEEDLIRRKVSDPRHECSVFIDGTWESERERDAPSRLRLSIENPLKI